MKKTVSGDAGAMRKGKERRERSETLVSKPGEGDEEIGKGEEEEVKGFFSCYLLCSLNPRFKGRTYIGFTINPRRRIRQHNGEIKCGAWRTKSKRPWEMILSIYGFPTNVSALQFEWAWQHPRESLAVRKAAASFKSLSGIANKIKLAYTMLTLPPWQSLKLTANFFSTKYMKQSAGCPSLPKQMRVQICPMDELPCYTGFDQVLDESNDDGYGEDEFDGNSHGDRQISGLADDISVSVSENYCSIVRTAHDQPRWIDDDSLRQPMDPLAPRDDHKLPFHLVDSPLRTPSSCISSLINRVETIDDRDSFGLIEESDSKLGRATKQPFCDVDDSLMKSSFSSITGLINTVKTVEDRDSFGQLIVEISSELDQSTKQQPTSPTAPNNDQPLNSFGFVEEGELGQATKQQPVTPIAANIDPPSSPDFEVINLLTPSSDCIIRSSGKKKRAASGIIPFRNKKRASSICHKIIDLTESPVFIQL